ncbi:MAG: type I 3-dehydroquinate dehydratase [Planctomycetota bacterium]
MNEPSRILVSLFAREESSLRRRLDWLRGRIGRVELRLDAMPDDLDLARLKGDYPQFEWIAACRSVPQTESRLARLMRAAEAGFDAVDFPFEEGIPPKLPHGVRRIHSWHQEEAADVDLRAVLDELRSRTAGDDLVKVVAWADFAEQAWPVLDLYKSMPSASLLAFAQGPGGGASRILALRCGTPWIYSCWPGENTAPGQWDVCALLDLLPEKLDLETPALGVIGNPVLHSLSPHLWTEAMRLNRSQPFGLYLPYPVKDLDAFLLGAKRHAVTAFSVTAPHKQQSFALGHALDGALGEAAKACRAANLLLSQDGAWCCGNSDGVGAMDALQVADAPAGSQLLILGAGAAASAVKVEAERRGWGVTLATRLEMQDVQPSRFQAVIQATPVGSVEHPGILCEGRPPSPNTPSLDMVYHPLQTEWLLQAEAAGARPIPGTQMLLLQMLAQYRAVIPDQPQPLSADLQRSLQQYLHDRQALVLIGARGSGKSTLGRMLAHALQWRFLDADEVLEQQSGRSVEDWIAHDLEGFRVLEAQVLSDMMSQPFTVVATGGGVVECASSVQRLQDHARVVWLECPAEELLRRQRLDPRPALTDLELSTEVNQLLTQRTPAYHKASSLVVSSNETPESAVEKVLVHFDLKGIVSGFR